MMNDKAGQASDAVKKLKIIEESVQRLWAESGIYSSDPLPSKPKKFVTFPYPYMSGLLHVGHALSATRVDVYARFMRLQGYNVLYPFAWHWTGEPIVGLAKRIARGDEKTLRILRESDGIPDSELGNFRDPRYIASYYTAEGKKAVARLGISVDWRREFTTAYNPGYSSFVTWQYLSLKEKGYVVQGSHPVIWCPNDKSPTGDHDRAEGEGVSPEAMRLVKFALEGQSFFVAATYRPETIFGATNLWVRPDGDYVEAEVDGEHWIISAYCASVLSEQKHEVKIRAAAKGADFVGKYVTVPLTGRSVPILPAGFVDTDFGTGVVYSVPAHAPYDYLGLESLRKSGKTMNESLLHVVQSISPISIIHVKGYGDFPAKEEVERLGVRDEYDPRAEEATQNVYKSEFNTGVMKDNCDGFAGMSVQDAREHINRELASKGLGGTYYETPKPVVCRCGTKCIVKILENQWFLKYSDPKWKSMVLEAINTMDIFPPEARPWFKEVVDWLQDKACARKSGMGTPLPWDPEWIVETLSDSTIYTAYYTISRYVNDGTLNPKFMTKAFFDYVFLGHGDASSVAKETGISEETLGKVRNEFLYWYPVDLRNSAKELISNHLTFFLFQHCALFPKVHWPRAVSVNGLMTVNGEGMHKSKGNTVTLEAALERYGADVTRCTVINGTENLEDPDWNEKAVSTVLERISAFVDLVEDVAENLRNREGARSEIDTWLFARLKQRLNSVSESIPQMRTRSAFNIAFYEVWGDLRRYLRRSTAPNRDVLLSFFREWFKLLHPFMPHVAQWAYNRMGFTGLIEREAYINPTLSREERESILKEEYIQRVEDDVSNLLKMIPGSKTLEFTTASERYLEVVESLISQSSLGAVNRQVVDQIGAVTGDRSRAASLAQRIVKIVSEWQGVPKEDLAWLANEEPRILEANRSYFEKIFGLKVTVLADSQGINRRGAVALPLKPAITLG